MQVLSFSWCKSTKKNSHGRKIFSTPRPGSCRSPRSATQPLFHLNIYPATRIPRRRFNLIASTLRQDVNAPSRVSLAIAIPATQIPRRGFILIANTLQLKINAPRRASLAIVIPATQIPRRGFILIASTLQLNTKEPRRGSSTIVIPATRIPRRGFILIVSTLHLNAKEPRRGSITITIPATQIPRRGFHFNSQHITAIYKRTPSGFHQPLRYVAPSTAVGTPYRLRTGGGGKRSFGDSKNAVDKYYFAVSDELCIFVF